MTGMERTIEQAAQVIAEAYRKGGDIWGDDLARALADAGLLAPAPLREEWGIQWDDGVWEYYRNRAETEVGAGDEGTPVHRYVSDWLPVDPTERDGSADRSVGNDPLGQIRRVLDKLAEETGPPCDHITIHEANQKAIHEISVCVYPEASE